MVDVKHMAFLLLLLHLLIYLMSQKWVPTQEFERIYNQNYHKFVRLDRSDIFFVKLEQDQFSNDDLSDNAKIVIFEMLKDTHVRLSS